MASAPPPRPGLQRSGIALIFGTAGFIVLLVLFAIATKGSSGSSAVVRGEVSSVTSSFTSAPPPSHEDSARFRRRASEIVRQNVPAGSNEGDHSWLSSLADTVFVFGDTTDRAVAKWIRSKQRADAEYAREQGRRLSARPMP